MIPIKLVKILTIWQSGVIGKGEILEIVVKGSQHLLVTHPPYLFIWAGEKSHITVI